MINHQIHHILHPPHMQPVNQLLHIPHRAIRLVDLIVIADVVPHVHLRTLEDGTQPDDVDVESLDVVEAADYAADVAGAGAGGVEEGGRVDLVDGGFLPPGAVYGVGWGHFGGGDGGDDSKWWRGGLRGMG